jgi:outer membrane protein TolC
MRWLSAGFLAAGAAVIAAYGQNPAGSPLGYSIATPRPVNPAANTTNPSARAAQSQNPYLGSVSSGPATDTTLQLSLSDAIQRGFRYNLGLVENVQGSAEARSRRLRALSAMLPNVIARAQQNFEKLSLKEVWLKLPPIPGFGGLPPTTASFGFQDARIVATQSVYNRQLREEFKARRAEESASVSGIKDARDVVVLVTGVAWFQVAASAARVDAARAQVESARRLDEQTEDQVKAEVAPEIDSLRSRVERQTSEQRLTNALNDLEKDKLSLARIIGLPIEQQFAVTETAAYVPLTGVTPESAKAEALRNRSDLEGERLNVKAAEHDVAAQRAQRNPTIGLTADYGAGGVNVGNTNQLFSVSASVTVPLYTGGRIRAEVDTARAELTRRQSELRDLEGRIAYDVRTAWLDVQASDSAVTVAQSNRRLAERALTQAMDRYTNGVTNYLEVVQAQEAVAQGNENYIASLYSFNVSKLALARAMGTAESRAREFFGS